MDLLEVGKPLGLNGLSWKRFVENHCGGRRGRAGRPDLVGMGWVGGGGGGGEESHRRNSTLVHSAEFTL